MYTSRENSPTNSVMLSIAGVTATESLPNATQPAALLAPAKEYDEFGAHAPRHAVAPTALPKRPAGHAAHAVLGLPSWSCVPGAHGRQPRSRQPAAGSRQPRARRSTPVALSQATVGADVVGDHVGLAVDRERGTYCIVMQSRASTPQQLRETRREVPRGDMGGSLPLSPLEVPSQEGGGA